MEASTTTFTAQCYELYELPPLGSLVKTGDIYGIVCHATTGSLEPGRKPIARGKDEASEEDIYHTSPQLTKLLRSEFSALAVGHSTENGLRHYLPPSPARIHSFVYSCAQEEVKEFSQSLDFLNILINTHLPVPPDELIAATLRQMSQAQTDPDAFLVTAGKELATRLSGDFPILKSILGRLK
ncbi:hypothetical protein ACFLXH_04710 [Chloroflexota bacterium]